MYFGSPDGAGRGAEPVLVTSSIGKAGSVLPEHEGRPATLEITIDAAMIDDRSDAIVLSKRREGRCSPSLNAVLAR